MLMISYLSAKATLLRRSILFINYYVVYGVMTPNFAKIFGVWELINIFRIVFLDISKSEGSSMQTNMAVLINKKIGS